MPQEIAIIGSGFSSLSAACYLAKAGNKVTVYEKKQYNWRKSPSTQKRRFYV